MFPDYLSLSGVVLLPKRSRAARALVPLALLTLSAVTGCGSGNGHVDVPQPAPLPRSRYVMTNLVADTAATATAAHTDANLVNPWGVSFSATGPFWLSNNHTGTSTLYDGSGTPQALVVKIPAAPRAGSTGSPTGQLFNTTTDFVVGTTGSPASFIFSSEDGVITAWNGKSGTNAAIVADRSTVGAVYKGIAFGSTSAGNFVYAADFHNGRIDQFDKNFQLVRSFTDPGVPAGFAPFNVQNIGGSLYVTFARQQGPDNHDDAPGISSGYVDIFQTDGTLVRRLISGGQLDSPWGLALAPTDFGAYSGDLLVGNFGDGRILAYDPNTGAFIGPVRDANGDTLVVPGLWAIAFGNGGRAGLKNTLYFTAGPAGENHGVFGSLQAQ